MVYAEITRAGREPEFLPVLENVAVGESHRVAVLEVAGKPNVWRVWVDGKPVTKPLLLPGSTKRWRPIATAESWNGGNASCNSFSFRFDGVSVASVGGGGWQAFVPGFTFQDKGFAVKRLSGAGASSARSPRTGPHRTPSQPRACDDPPPLRRRSLCSGGNDADRRADGDPIPQVVGALVGDPHAAVGDLLAEQPRLPGAVQADDTAAGPLGQLRVCARLERERAEERLPERLEADGHVVEPRRGLHAGCTDRHLRLVQLAVVLPDLQHLRAAEDDDLPRHRLDVDVAGAHPADTAVGATRNRDLVPGRLPRSPRLTSSASTYRGR